MNKEEVYDDLINPLMAQVLKICVEHKIAMLLSFAIPTPDDDGLRCTSALLSPEYDPPQDFIRAMKLVMPPERKISMTKLTLTKADGTKEVQIIATI